jgi:hypothetical protein
LPLRQEKRDFLLFRSQQYLDHFRDSPLRANFEFCKNQPRKGIFNALKRGGVEAARRAKVYGTE